ncbi:hypothetical protein F5B22DRAFT_181784 [Xylaria bambusicola]|uniref:uncharacterized protein n=1 Tax=Xylaria bambusicola TaxID=326684 RepID=UPI002008946A|nr:uncharacterized protein F5B22DRAFT_181784 [Xylaria bambusicola]KAI0516818.1 hypothetical protein F5B22DRAFT_181784 [Xylaria bambusicola]
MHKLVSRSRSLMEGKGGRRHAGTKAPVALAPDEPLHGGPESVSNTTLHVPLYNYYATPVDSLNEVDQYARRPLPATPPSIAKMADRPSTSGGSASRKSVKIDFKFDKRVSRDDFYLGSRVYRESRAEPVPRPWDELLTPDASPKTKFVPKFAPRTNLTVNASVEVLNGGIGMALGSPSHTRNFSDPWNTPNSARPRQDSHPIATPPESRSSSVDTFDMPVLRKPSSKWKLFGIFSRKPPDQPVPAISISDPNGLYGTNRPEEAVAARQAPLPESNNPTRSNTTTSRKGFKHKPILIRSQTLPSDAQVDSYDQRPRAGEKQSRGPSPAPLPLLNVEIPDVRLERYSVMFDGVLKSNPSLLSRRQATVPKLKSIKDVVEREEEEKPYGVARRATSPQPATKPSGFLLFPTNRENQVYMPQKISPRHRSNTSLALLPSPARATFNHNKAPDYRRPSVEHPTSLRPPPQTFHYDIESPGMAVTTDVGIIKQEISPSSPPRFRNGQSNLILDSPSEIDSEDDEETVAREAWKPASHHVPPEPKWQMMVPSQKTPSTASSNTSSDRKRSPSLASSSYTHITRVSEDSDDASPAFFKNSANNIAITAKMTPVEISIARQITVSRQQRKLLQPLRTVIPPAPAQPSSSSSSGRRPSHPSPARTSPMAGVPRGEPGRIAETKTSTPTLVSPDSLDPNQSAARAQLRRSERIVLEDA